MSKRMFKRGLLGGAVMAAAVAAVPDTSDAGLVYDLRIVSGGTATGAQTADSKTLTSTGTVLLQLWARVTGTDGDTSNEGLQTNYIVLQSSEVSGDAFSGGITAGARQTPFNGSGSRNGGAADLNGDGVNDWGSNSNDATDTFYMLARSAAYAQGGAVGNAVDANTWEFRVANFTLTASALLGLGDTRISVIKPAFTTSGSQPAYAVYWDDAADNVSNSDPVNDPNPDGLFDEGTQSIVDSSNAAGVHGDFVTISVVPEPASLSILGLAGAGLLSRRRRVS